MFNSLSIRITKIRWQSYQRSDTLLVSQSLIVNKQTNNERKTLNYTTCCMITILHINNNNVSLKSTGNHATEETNSMDMDIEEIKHMSRQQLRQEYYTSEWIRGIQLFDRIFFIGFLIATSFLLAGSFTLNWQ